MRVFFLSFVKAIKQHFATPTPLIMQVASTMILLTIFGFAMNSGFSGENYKPSPGMEYAAPWGEALKQTAADIAAENGKTPKEITEILNDGGGYIQDIPGKKPFRAMDYYTITMIVLTLIMSGNSIIGRLEADFLGPMKRRLAYAPSGLTSILAGDVAATTVTCFLQMAFVLLFARVAYGVSLGGGLWVTLGTMLLLSFVGQTLSALLTLALGNGGAASGLLMSLAFAFAFFSGGFYAAPIGGTVGRFLGSWGTPNSLAQTAIFGGIYGGDGSVIALALMLLAALGLLLLGLTALAARKKVLA